MPEPLTRKLHGPRRASDRYTVDALERAFNRFSEFTLLGEGGFGSVFSVWDHVRTQYVALKITREGGDSGWRKRFVQEYDILRVVHSPRLVMVYDASVSRIDVRGGGIVDHLWYTMERCTSCVESELPRLGLADRARLCIEMLDGLAILHERNIAHRDLKPKNLFLARDGGLKIGDFGLAKDTSTSATQETPAGKCLGTFEYLAPERWHGGDEAATDWRPSDQYAAGITIYQLLSRGRDPLDFGERNVFACLNAHLHGAMQPLRVPETSCASLREIDRVVARMLAKDPARRHPTIARCKRELESAFKLHDLA